SILENFDEEVAARLKDCKEKTVAGLNAYSRLIYHFFLIHSAGQAKALDPFRIMLGEGESARTYNIDWKSAEEYGDIFLRREDPLYLTMLEDAAATPAEAAVIEFDFTGQDRNISYLANHVGMEGIISVDKLCYSGIGEEEHLVITAKTTDGTLLDEATVNNIFELPAKIVKGFTAETGDFTELRRLKMEQRKQSVEETNKAYYLQECAKLDAYSEDLKEGLKHELKELKKTITQMKKEFRESTHLPLADMLAFKEKIDSMQKKRKKMEREINIREDEIDEMNERLQEEVRSKLKGNSAVIPIMTIGFKIK
ncbi:MAG: hypothetical protein HUJ86_07565, partial [Synergistes sp.]|nr:hypothetical protein [Synergistes sp.]